MELLIANIVLVTVFSAYEVFLVMKIKTIEIILHFLLKKNKSTWHRFGIGVVRIPEQKMWQTPSKQQQNHILSPRS